jgi:predicted dehydrogenase
MTIKIAMLGTWHVHAKDHVASLLARQDQVEIVGIWDADASAAQSFADEWGIAVLPDLEELLARPDIDGVVVDTATVEHLALLSRAAEAGKHLFAEKVLAATSREATAIVAAAVEHNVTVTIAMQRLTEAFAVTLAEQVASGTVGTVTSVRTRFSHGGAYAPWLPEYFFDPSQAQGGVLIDLAAHSLYLGMLYAGGVPQRVIASAGSVTQRASEDNVAVVMSYDSGTLVVAESSFVAGFSSFQVEIVGTRGTLAVDSADLTVRLRKSEDSGWTDLPMGARQPESIDLFLEAITTGKQDQPRLETARALTAVVEAAYHSIATRTSVAIEWPV